MILLEPFEDLIAPKGVSDYISAGRGIFTEPLLPDLPSEAEIRLCPSPTCGCFGLEFRWPPVEGDAEPRIVSIDLGGQSIQPAGGPSARAIANVFRERMNNERWQDLHTFFGEVKARLVDQSTPPYDIDVEYLAGLLASGAMIRYQEIFPYAAAMAFETPSGRWIVDDH